MSEALQTARDAFVSAKARIIRAERLLFAAGPFTEARQASFLRIVEEAGADMVSAFLNGKLAEPEAAFLPDNVVPLPRRVVP